MALYMCNTSNIKEMEIGRPQTVAFDGNDAKPNGSIVELKDTVEKTKGRENDHVHQVEFKELASVIGKFIIVAPEVNVEQYRLIDGQIGKFMLQPNQTYTAYELQKYDRIEYTDAYYADASALVVGDTVKVNAAGKFEKVAGGAGALRVVTILPTFYPVVMQPHTQGNNIALMPQSGLKIKLEVVK